MVNSVAVDLATVDWVVAPISYLGSIAWTITLTNYGAGGAGAWQV